MVSSKDGGGGTELTPYLKDQSETSCFIHLGGATEQEFQFIPSAFHPIFITSTEELIASTLIRTLLVLYYLASRRISGVSFLGD